MFRALCLLLLTVLLGSASAQLVQAKASITRWPQDRASAISLTFDDGINTDLDYAGPILKKPSDRIFFRDYRDGTLGKAPGGMETACAGGK